MAVFDCHIDILAHYLRMKRLIFKVLLFCLPVWTTGQTVSLDSCRARARQNYPLLKQYGLIEEKESYDLSNAGKAYFPQVGLSVKATYQSDVTRIPESLEDILSQMSGREVSFPALSQDQYQAVIEVNQLIWDGGLVGARKKAVKASSEVERQKLEVDLYALNERVNNLFFGILLIDDQIKLNRILQDELKTNYERAGAYLQNGIALPSDLDVVEVEIINARQHDTDLNTLRKTYIMMLSAFTGQKMDENTTLEKPVMPVAGEITENNRPELLLFEAQHSLFGSQRDAVFAGNLPKIGLFVQGGYGRPGLNMFTSAFSPFYIGGIRLSWNLSGLYSQKNDLHKIQTGQRNIEVQKETFLFNNDMQTKQQQNEIERLRLTLKNDEKIIRLRENIRKSAESKVENGTMTMTDLMREINAENMAKQTRSVHEIQLYSAIYQLKNNVNN